MSTPTILTFDASSMFGKLHTQKVAKIHGLNITLFAENDQKAAEAIAPAGITYHWTAGGFLQCWDDYNFNVAWDAAAKRVIIVRTLNWHQKGKHLWGYNSGMVGITLCAMGTPDLVPTADMIEAAAILTAEICAWKHIDPTGTLALPAKKNQGGALVEVGGLIHPPTIHDHAWFAKANGYFPDRWDVGAYYPKLVERSRLIYRELKGAPMPGGGKRDFQLEELLK